MKELKSKSYIIPRNDIGTTAPPVTRLKGKSIEIQHMFYDHDQEFFRAVIATTANIILRCSWHEWFMMISVVLSKH